MPPQRPAGRKKTIITASIVGVLVVALFGGIGAWAATKFWNDAGDQAEKAMPATVIAYARLDLDPSLDQSVKILSVLRKFPSIAENSATDLSGTEEEVFDGLDLDGLSYASDIEPWFDHKIGFGLWTNSGNNHEPYALITLSSSDDAKAEAALEKAAQTQAAGVMGYSVSDGWALIALGESDSQSAADQAATEAQEGNLADSGDFSDALGSMPDGQVAISWVNFDQLQEELSYSGYDEYSWYSEFSGVAATMHGHLLAAAQASGSGLEFRLRVDGLEDSSPLGSDVLDDMGDLPGNSTVAMAGALSSEIPSTYVDTLTEYLEDSYIIDSGSDDIVRAIFDTELFTLSMLDSDEGTAKLTVTSRSSDSADLVAEAFESLAAYDVTVSQDGTSTIVESDGYDSSAEGTLSQDGTYTSAMADMPGNTGFALYLNVQDYMAVGGVPSDIATELGPLQAVGVGIGGEGDTMEALIRIVIS